MPRQLARILEFLESQYRIERSKNGSCISRPNEQDETNEVSEYEDALLVRLGRGCAMQIRVQPGGAGVLFRIVPIANVTRLEGGDSSWQAASDSQLRSWLHSDSSIGHWLAAKGFDGDKFASPVVESASRAMSAAATDPFWR